MKTPDSSTDRKSALEIEKLELELENERARRGMEALEQQKAEGELLALRLDNEGRERERDQADLAKTKLRLEVEDLARGRQDPWQRAQVIVVILGVLISTFSAGVSCFTYRKSVRDAHEKDIQTAAEHLQSGYPSGAVELGRYDDALGILVRSVDATHATVQKSWPVVTRAALDEIYKRRGELTGEQKKLIEKAMTDSDDVIQTQLLAVVNRMPASSEPPQSTTSPVAEADEKQTKLLLDYVCIQLDLQRVLSKTPDNWDKTSTNVKGQLGGEPHC